jgi:galactokinase
MTGGGFGGTAVALVPGGARDPLMEAFGKSAFEVAPAGGVRRTAAMG